MKQYSFIYGTEVNLEIWRLFLREYLLSTLTSVLGLSRPLLDLNQVIDWMGIEGEEHLDVKSVNIHQIIGVRGPCSDFDGSLRPMNLAKLIVEWVHLAALLQQGAQLPYLPLFKFGGGFFFEHQTDIIVVSVLKALGHKKVMADIKGPISAGIPSPTIEKYIWWHQEKQKSRA